MGFGLFILGPGAGIAIGLLGVAALDLIRKRLGVRRDYESLYSLGVAFSAFAAAEAVHGSGFLAAFAAGLTIAALDVELCDCFIEYGGVTAEMLLLFTFVILGSFADLDRLLRTQPGDRDLCGVCGADSRARLSAFADRFERRSARAVLIAWYGPSGLSSLLLVLLAVFAGMPGSDRLFAICSLIVLLSVVLHGASPMFLTLMASKTKPEAAPLPEAPTTDSGSATLADLDRLQKSGDEVILLDVRTERSRDTSDSQAAGSVRMPPEDVVAQARKLDLPKEAWLLAYCA